MMKPNHDDNGKPSPSLSIPFDPRRLSSANPSSMNQFASDNGTNGDMPPEYEYLNNPWYFSPGASSYNPPQHGPRPTHKSTSENGIIRPSSRSASTSAIVPPTIVFPEPQIHRSVTARARPTTPSAPRRQHQTNRGDFQFSPHLMRLQHTPSVASFSSSYSTASSYYRNAEDYQDALASPTESFSFPVEQDDMARELSNLSLDMNESIERFQKGELKDADQEWHRLVPEEARDALDKNEVQRQSVIFEVFKAEREYVADLEAVEEVFIRGIMESSPLVIQEPHLSRFIHDAFGNFHEILVHHQRMLAALFERQRDEHPLVPSISDIILETAFKPDFRAAYEKYIKHYPLAESCHRTQMKKNPAYELFIQSVSNNPRIRKRDLVTFLSRPVTRLPRLNLLLEQILKLTDVEHNHPDLETLPIILNILSDCIKSTQPGIEAAESRVKFWALIESLVLQPGEIIDLDPHDKERNLVYLGPVWRRIRSDTSFSDKWTEMTVALLDNYLLITREEQRNGVLRRILMSRPVPLAFIRLASFESQPELRRERIEEGNLLDTFRSQTVPYYPFTLYHASTTTMKAYTLYVTSDAIRKKWYSAFKDALGIYTVKQDGNMWYAQNQLTDRTFRLPSNRETTSQSQVTGKITCAIPFALNGGRFLAVGCAAGIFVAPFGTEDFRMVLRHSNPTSMQALQAANGKVFNKLIVHVDSTLLSYSLDLVVRTALGHGSSQILEASLERIAGTDHNVVFCRHMEMGQRVLLVYASKKRLSSSLSLNVLEAISASELSLSPQRAAGSTASSFRPYGDAGYAPGGAYDVIALMKTIGVCTREGIITADPTNIANSARSSVPVLHDSSSNPLLAHLKSQLEGAKALGFIRVDEKEILVIYDELGCFIDKRGVPTRQCRYIKWETKATSYAHRNGHILLVSPRFVEIRSVPSGRILQVIEGGDIRLLFSEPRVFLEDNILLAMRGRFNDAHGLSEKIVELTETSEISSNANSPLWDDWDM